MNGTPLNRMTGGFCLVSPGFLFNAPFHFAAFNKHSFAAINWKHKLNSFSEVCESFQRNTEPEGGLGDPRQSDE